MMPHQTQELMVRETTLTLAQKAKVQKTFQTPRRYKPVPTLTKEKTRKRARRKRKNESII